MLFPFEYDIISIIIGIPFFGMLFNVRKSMNGGEALATFSYIATDSNGKRIKGTEQAEDAGAKPTNR